MSEHSEREWLAQERARAGAQDLPVHGEHDVRARSYRQIARALREPPPVALSPDFARRLAARAAARDAAPFESALIYVLVAAFAICAAVLVMRFGSRWVLEARANTWLLAFAACAGASWVMEKWPRRVR
jgi:hypothetical protein